MRELVYDAHGKLPRFVIFEDVVVNQREGGEEACAGDWRSAYLNLHKQWKGGQGND
jgi:hypothetical protein